MTQDNRVVVNGIAPVINLQSDNQEWNYDSIQPVTFFAVKNQFVPITNISAIINIDLQNNEKEILNIKTEFNNEKETGTIELNTAFYEEDTTTQQVIRKTAPGIKTSFLERTERIDDTDNTLITEEEKTVKNAKIDIYGDIDVHSNFIHRVKDPVLGKDVANKDYIDTKVPDDPVFLNVENAPYYGWNPEIGGFTMIRDYTFNSHDIIQTVFFRRLLLIEGGTIPFKICSINKANKQVTFSDNVFNNLPDNVQTKNYILCPLPSLSSIGCIILANQKIWLGTKTNSNSTTEQTTWSEITSLFNNSNFLNNVVVCNDMRFCEGTIHFLFSAEKVNYKYDEQYYVTLSEADLTAFLTAQTITPADITPITGKNYCFLKVNNKRVLFSTWESMEDKNGNVFISADGKYNRSFLTLDDFFIPNAFSYGDFFDNKQCFFTYYSLSDEYMKANHADFPIVIDNAYSYAPHVIQLPNMALYPKGAWFAPAPKKRGFFLQLFDEIPYTGTNLSDDTLTTEYYEQKVYGFNFCKPLQFNYITTLFSNNMPLSIFNSYMDEEVYIHDCGEQLQGDFARWIICY